MKKIKFAKPKKVSKSKLKKKADVLFSKKVRASGVCLNCGTIKNLQCAHLISRSYKNTRWDVGNAICLCKGCHLYFTYRPLEWEQFVLKIIGRAKYKKLKHKALMYDFEIDYEKIIKKLS